jgi:hypothetical protein
MARLALDVLALAAVVGLVEQMAGIKVVTLTEVQAVLMAAAAAHLDIAAAVELEAMAVKAQSESFGLVIREHFHPLAWGHHESLH